jgi:hypothetical protein
MDFVVLRTKKALEEVWEGRLLNFEMYRWLLRCLEAVMANEDSVTRLFHSHGLQDVLDPEVEFREYYVLEGTVSRSV